MSFGGGETQSQKDEEAELKRQEALRKQQQTQLQQQAVSSIKRRGGLGFGGTPSASLFNPPGSTLG